MKKICCRGGWTGHLLQMLFIATLGVALVAASIRAEGWKDRLSMKIGGGLDLLGWGDVNTLKDSFHQQVHYTAGQFGIETTGKCENPRIGWQGEVELQFDLSHWFSLGLALGLSRRSGEAILNADWPPFLTSRHIWNQTSRITHTVFGCYGRIPLSSRVGAYARAGAGFGSAIWKYKIRNEETIDFTSWEQIEGTARDSGVVFQAGLGFEIRMMKQLSVFAEVQGQILSLSDWRTNQINSTDVNSEEISGKLWLVERASSGGRPPQTLLVASEFSPGLRLYNDFKAFNLNLSGCIFLVGLKLEMGWR